MPRKSIKVIVDSPEELFSEAWDAFMAGFVTGGIMEALEDLPPDNPLKQIKLVKIKIGTFEYPVKEKAE